MRPCLTLQRRSATTAQIASTSPNGQAPLQKSVGRPQRAGGREAEDEPRAAILQRVTHQHRRNGEQAE
jgi:hypothetical protein